MKLQEDEGVWVPEAEDAESPEQQEVVPLGRVMRIVETVYGQRQDKEHNPHGEHAHDVWQVGRQPGRVVTGATIKCPSPVGPVGWWLPALTRRASTWCLDGRQCNATQQNCKPQYCTWPQLT